MDKTVGVHLQDILQVPDQINIYQTVLIRQFFLFKIPS
jgi:hypothetical protein